MAVLGLALFTASASADSRIPELGVARGQGAGQVGTPLGLAVNDKEAGDIYVADQENSRIIQFTPAGAFVRAFGWGVVNGASELQVCTESTGCRRGIEGSGPGQLRWSDEIAVDNYPGTLAEPNSSYGDIYVVDQRNWRIEKYSSDGTFELMFGGEVNKTSGEDVCTAADIAGGDVCGRGVPGTGPSHFYAEEPADETGEGGAKSWFWERSNSIAVGPGGTVFVGDYGRIQEFESDGTFAGEFKLPDEGPVVGTGNLTKGSTTVTSLSTTSGVFHVGQPISGAGIPFDSAIVAIGGGTLTLSNPAAQSATGVTLTVEPQFVTALAVDSAGNIYERSATYTQFGNSRVSQIPGVREYNTESPRTLVRTFDAESGSEPTHISLDSASDLFISDSTGSELQFLAYRPTGILYAILTSSQAEVGTPESLGGIAVGDAAGNLYASVGPGSSNDPHVAVISPLPVSGPPSITKEEATNIEPTTATLHAVVNPEQFDTHYHFQYVDQGSFEHEGGFASPHTQSSPSPPDDLGPISRADRVQAAVSGLATDTVYHYRAVAESECEPIAHPGHICVTEGPDQIFESLPPVSIREFTTQTVGPELVTLKAELNPNGSATRYTVRYGMAPGYSCEPGNTCSVEGTLLVGSEFVPLEREGKEGVTFTGLRPNTEYHYQIVAESEANGKVETADQTFTTEPSPAEERAAENCPNTNLREENNSLALLDCRAYEQVSAIHKEGGQAFQSIMLAPDGERAVYLANGAFAGAASNEAAVWYLAQRSPSGWSTRAVEQRSSDPEYQPKLVPEFSAGLDRWTYTESKGLSSQVLSPTSFFYSLGSADGTFNFQASSTINAAEGQLNSIETHGQSSDLSRIFIIPETRLLSSDPRPSIVRTFDASGDRIYEISGIGSPSPTLRLAAEVPLGLTHNNESPVQNGCYINNEPHGQGGRFSTADGSTIFYTSPIEVVAGAPCGEGSPNPVALFARTGEADPVQLNASPASQCSSPSPCASAVPATPLYDGASPDGSFVWFTTTQPLINSDTDTTNDLYVARLEGGSLSELLQASVGEATPTHPTPGQGADVGGVARRISPDGTHAAFESSAVLTTEENSVHQSAVKGANNLYVYDARSGETKFVATVSAADAPLWTPGNTESLEVTFTPDGRYFLFTSWGRLTPDDTDNAPDLYRYDFQTGQLIRLSIGRNGNDGNGNDNEYPVELFSSAGTGSRETDFANDEDRSVSADGSTVVFRTAAPLVSHDTNTGANPGCNAEHTGCDIYEWEEHGAGTCNEAGGCISLVSDGVAPHGATVAVISSSGQDITFHTLRNEIPADTDGVGDIYDARIDGGFHALHPSVQCGSPEACREPPRAQPAPPTLGTPNFVGPGNAKAQLRCAKGRHRIKKHGQVRCVPNRLHKLHQHKRRHHKSGNRHRPKANNGGVR